MDQKLFELVLIYSLMNLMIFEMAPIYTYDGLNQFWTKSLIKNKLYFMGKCFNGI